MIDKTPEEIIALALEWAKRHDITGSATDVYAMFTDAQYCAALTAAQPVPPADVPETDCGNITQPAALTAYDVEPAQPDAKTCDWIESDPWGDMPSTYKSDCGEAWSFIDGGPKENNVRFCHGCGCTVSVVPFTDTDAAIKATS